MQIRKFILVITLLGISIIYSQQKENTFFEYLDVFELEYASDPQISPNSKQIVYRRMGFDIQKDRSKGSLWIVSSKGANHQKLTSQEANESQPRWSPNGNQIAFVSSTDQGSELFVYWKDSKQFARITQLKESPSSISWSPDGKQIAFLMKVPKAPPVIAKMPTKPKGAKWAKSPRITDRLKHEADGRGYLSPGFTHVFIVPSEGGTPQQLTYGDFNHSGTISWHPNNQEMYVSGNRNEDWEYDYVNSEVYKIGIKNKTIVPLTDRKGPDFRPVVSPDGKKIAYLSFEDKVQAYQLRQLHIMNTDGSDKRIISQNLDRTISRFQWDSKSKGLYISYDEYGNSKIDYINLEGTTKRLANNMGGTSIGRPYAGGSFSVSNEGVIAYTHSLPAYPAEVAILKPKDKTPKLITQLNNDLLGNRILGEVEEIWYKSSIDKRDIQGWVVYPPNYDPSKKYPLLVENHGGPILNYGDRFSAEIQLYAAAGYIVFYPNPRGSTSYGEEFGNLLYNNYPGEDYNDVMDGVDELIKKGVAHEDQLYVTGGSAGGIMTAWIIGKNTRFEAAVVAKPVMNWISKTLVADNYYGYANYRYPGQPWENVQGYWKFSPISLVGNVQTPTMVMVGMNDLRTPPSEAKQLYHALKLRKIETVLVEIPEASHGIAARPSNLITKVAHTLAWFEKYRIKK
ncbi:S9 family peptidase [Ascidiimonas sp. W6]|uniref:S9 family peptidase n=1 Tax=Ascidiimonas meishanensis TaxID=3128903 RepID=UPI0030EEE475